MNNKVYSTAAFTVTVANGLEETVFNGSAKPVAYYDLQGHKLEELQAGTLVIAVLSDGSKRKIVVQ